MPLLTPSKRWQKAYNAFKKRRLSEKIEENLEKSFKGMLWGCRMCGNCLLQETAFICPMACPKGLRNGPCGGSTPDHCCVDESRPCIWHEIYRRAEKMGRLEKLLEVMPPLDWDKTGTSALKDVFIKLNEKGTVKTITSAIHSTPEERKLGWDHFFKEIRQPEWWDGDSLPHPAPPHKPVSKLEEGLTKGKFTITCEVVPPLSSDLSSFNKKLSELKSVVDGVNITDSASAVPRVSSIACAVHAVEVGIEPVLQMAARDRTRLSFQADLIGASALGIRNLLLITGDHPNKGMRPFSRMDIWDFDSIQAVWMARKLRDEGIFLDGREVISSPSYFIGAAAAPYASLPKYQAIRAEKKLNVGAQFFQTNLIFDIERFEAYLEALDKRNILNKMNLIAGVTLIRSIKGAHFMHQLPGVEVPDKIFQRLEQAKDIKKESYQLCLETIEKIKSLTGVQGIHLMAINNTDTIKQLILDSNLRGIN
jgi:methylenetetrahydrofolate reductase (NADPH)